MPEEFDSIYRVVGFGDRARRMALYDINRGDSIWVNTVGYDEEIRSTLEVIESGNVVEAVITDAGDENEYWNLLDIEIIQKDTLYYVPTDGYAPGPTDGFWEEKAEDSNIVTAGRKDDETGEQLYEIHVQAKNLEVDGEMVNVYNALQRGDLLTEPLFHGNGCDHLEDGAEAIIVVNPDGKPYIVIYMFPEHNDAFKDIWGDLYDYVEG